MARGFESKSVADQQEEAQRRAVRRGPPPDPESLRLAARRRALELARCDLLRRRAAACTAGQRAGLEQALAALEVQLAALGPEHE